MLTTHNITYAHVYESAYDNAWREYDSYHRNSIFRTSVNELWCTYSFMDREYMAVTLEKIAAHAIDELYFMFRDELYEWMMHDNQWKQYSDDIDDFTRKLHEGDYPFVDEFMNECFAEIDIPHDIGLFVNDRQLFCVIEDRLCNPPLKGVW